MRISQAATHDGPRRRNRLSLRAQVLLLQCGVVAVVLAAAFGAFAYLSNDRLVRTYQLRAVSVARTVAAQPTVREAAARYSAAAERPGSGAEHTPRRELARTGVRKVAEAVRQRTGSLFVVVTDDRGIRLAHPSTAQLGRKVSTDPTRALSGREELAHHRAHLGDEVVAKVPVYAPGSGGSGSARTVVGEANVGVPAADVHSHQVRVLLGGLGLLTAALLLGVGASALLARRWRRLTLGLEPDELAGLVQEQEAVLHGIGEGVLALDPRRRVTVANGEARRLLNTPLRPGSRLADLGLTPRVLEAVREAAGHQVLAVVGERVLVVSARPVERGGRDLGTLVTVQDRTDVESLTRQLDAVRSMSSALRAQRHEFANRLHALLGLVHGGHTDRAADYLAELLGSGPLGETQPGAEAVGDPYLRAFLAAKGAHARESGVTLVLGGGTWVEGTLVAPVDVTTVLGNLLDNAVDAARAGTRTPPRVEVELLTEEGDLLVTVADTGDGVPEGRRDEVFREGVSSKAAAQDPAGSSGGIPGGRGVGLALARQLARARGGEVTLAAPGAPPQPSTPGPDRVPDGTADALPVPGSRGVDVGPQRPEQPAAFAGFGSAAGNSAVSASGSAAVADAVADAASGEGHPEDDRVSGGAVFVARLPQVLARSDDPADAASTVGGGPA